MTEKISTDDFVAISDHIGRYCWLVDRGDADAWAALWTQDCVFVGAGPEPLVGHDALRGVVNTVVSTGMRHLFGNLSCDYLDDKDTVKARYYNFITTWKGGGAFFSMVLSELTLVRDGQGWLISRNDSKICE